MLAMKHTMSKVLIVDDSPAQIYNLRKIVEQGGYQAIVANCGERALEVASDEQPEVILMDIVMPGMSGYQATRHLGRNANTANIPVIFVSTLADEADKIWGMRQGARDYITKPVNAQVLLSAISAAMAA
jgi:twitching motility two-component system response regulator PilH